MLAAQETLTPEAASVLKHSLSLATIRSHAQISPLHAVQALLSSGPNLLRRACEKSLSLSSSSHPLQCRALQKCFNDALNRLPQASNGGSRQPLLSDALVAVLKRAQMRTGFGVLKVTLDQLVLSILDDPTVDWVMKEAGFSSVRVKGCLVNISVSSSVFPAFSGNPRLQIEEDVKLLIDVLMGNKSRRNCVIVGDSVLTAGVVAGFMGKVGKGDLKSAKIIHFQFSSAELSFMKKEEVELNVWELRMSVDGAVTSGRGVIIYAGDLKWTAEVQKLCNNNRYNPVDHLVGEIGRLLRSYSNSKVWLVATASFRSYMSQIPLDALWLLEPLFLPLAGSSLNLNPASGSSHKTNMGQLLCEKRDCRAKNQKSCEAGLQISPNVIDWTKNQGGKDKVLKRKWSSVFEELHPHRHDENNVRQGFCLNNYGSSIQDNGDFPNLDSLKGSREGRNVSTTLSLGNSPVSDDAAADKSTEEMIMCSLLQEHVPWQSSSIPSIVRSLMSSKELKTATWFLIQGDDILGKRRLARGIAQVLHGSSASLVHLNLRTMSGKNSEMLKHAFRDGRKLVFLLENVDFLDVELSEFLEHGFRYGMGTLGHPIFILTISDDNASSDSVVQMEILVYEDSTDLNEIPRKEEGVDLNVKLEECGEEQNSLSFLPLIKTLVFNRNPVEDKKMREMILSNITASFEQVFGTRNLDCFSVREKVVDGISLGSATFLPSLFQEWLKHTFRSSLKSIRFSGEGSEQFKVRLCVMEDYWFKITGFRGSCLPMHIPVRYVD